MFGDFYKNKKILITGHTGFKGSWLSQWLLMLGANVVGYSLEPDTEPSIFKQLGLSQRVKHHLGDIRDQKKFAKFIQSTSPDIVFHLAAQPLVRQSYEEPLLTYETNVIGTVHLLNALRRLEKPCAAVFITTDKCYENRESDHAYLESDPLGGYDPYSSSKACAEIAIHSFRRSFFNDQHTTPVSIASARAGNVIGGGDWAADRIVPDCMRSLPAGQPISVRNANATRPWQHVLEPLSGYLQLGRLLAEDAVQGQRKFCDAFNFGPGRKSNQNVRVLVEEILKHWAGNWNDNSDPNAPHEAGLLHLNIEKARESLGWKPVWDFEKTIEQTVIWYRKSLELKSDSTAIATLTENQILEYQNIAINQKLAWTI